MSGISKLSEQLLSPEDVNNMKDRLIVISIIILGVCILMTALPDYREMDRKKEVLRGCMKQDTTLERWQILAVCNSKWSN